MLFHNYFGINFIVGLYLGDHGGILSDTVRGEVLSKVNEDDVSFHPSHARSGCIRIADFVSNVNDESIRHTHQQCEYIISGINA